MNIESFGFFVFSHLFKDKKKMQNINSSYFTTKLTKDWMQNLHEILTIYLYKLSEFF